MNESKLGSRNSSIALSKTSQFTKSDEKPPLHEDKGGLYLYGLAFVNSSESLGHVGLDGAEVYTVPCSEGICAIVHDSSQQPYWSKEAQVVERWVKEHEEVVEVAIEKFGSIVIPFRFDTIIRPRGEDKASAVLNEWISSELPALKEKIEKIKGRKEYGIQVSCDVSAMDQKLLEECSDAASKENNNNQPTSAGTTYLRKLESENAMKRRFEAGIASYFSNFYDRISKTVDQTKIGKTGKQAKGTIMIMNLSVLATNKDSSALGQALEEISREGFSIRFTGPWPPYSFV